MKLIKATSSGPLYTLIHCCKALSKFLFIMGENVTLATQMWGPFLRFASMMVPSSLF